VHTSLGVDVDADDVERSRASYAIGGTLQIHPRVAALLDVVGTSGFVANDLQIDAFGIQPQSRFLDQFQTRPTQVFGVRHARVFSSVPRTDTVDLAVGAKVQLFSRAAGFVSVLVPIVRDGLRASAVPVGGVEYTF
jgi:hypothetical protein